MQKEEYEHYQMQEALQKQQLDLQQSLYAPQMQEQVAQSQAVLVEQTNPDKVVKVIMLRLMGKKEQPDGTLIQVAEPKMNKEGLEDVWFILDSHINQNVIFSSLTDKEISRIMDVIQDNLTDNISLNWKRYGMKKQTDLDTVSDSILVNIFLALKRAERQNEKNWLGRISFENVSGSSKLPSMKKEGFWSKFRLG